MKFIIIGMIVITIASIVFEFVSRKKENQLYEDLTKLIVTKDYKKFDEVIDLPETRKHFPKFNHLFFKLNKEILVGNAKKVEELMEQLDALKLTSKQKEAYYPKAFYYAIAKADNDLATKYHDLYMAGCKNGREEIDRVFNTVIEKGDKYLDVTLQQLKTASPTGKIQLYSLLTTMYENRGEMDKAEEYTEKLKKQIDKISK